MSLSEKPSLCTMSTLAEHIFLTKKLPSCTELFMSSSEPHKMMVTTTVERWIESFPSSSGMDTAVFKVRSVRGGRHALQVECLILYNLKLNSDYANNKLKIEILLGSLG